MYCWCRVSINMKNVIWPRSDMKCHLKRFIFKHSSPCSPHTSLTGIAVLGSHLSKSHWHIQGFSEELWDWMCCVSYRQKRDKQIKLLFNMISQEYITVILAFCNSRIFFSDAFVYTSFSGHSSYEQWRTNKPEIFGLVWENFITTTWNTSRSIWRWHHIAYTCFWEAQEVGRELWGSERWLQEWEAINKQDWGQR